MLFLKILSVLTFVSMITINYLANALPIGGNTTGDISGKYQSLFTPSGFTFSIWGLIYVLLGVFVLYLFLQADETLTKHATSILIFFNLVNLFNGLWLFAWHHDLIFLSTLVMIGLLVCLLIILSLVSIQDKLAYATFSIYAGWISVALIANITIWIVKADIDFFMNHEYLWFFVILGASLVIGLIMIIKEKNYYYGAVFLWAYIGIASKFL